MIRRRNPRYVHEFTDRHGRARYYLRRFGKRTPLPGLPWSPEFMAAYQAALSTDGPAVPIGAGRTIPGTVNAALVSYYSSSAFRDELGDGTRKSRRAILERFREEHGDKRIALLHTGALQRTLEPKSPAARRNWRKALRGFLHHAMAQGSLKHDPTVGLQLGKMRGAGHHTWTTAEIAQYEARHLVGSKAYLALQLLLHTGHARADVVRMGLQHVRGGVVSMRRQKTSVPFDIPVLPGLRAALDSVPQGQMTFLLTELGQPFTAAGFGNWFKEQCYMANLPHCSAHGLRKAAATRFAEAGATAPELMAWFGWRSIREAQRYIEEANRKKLAVAAGEKVRTANKDWQT